MFVPQIPNWIEETSYQWSMRYMLSSVPVVNLLYIHTCFPCVFLMTALDRFAKWRTVQNVCFLRCGKRKTSTCGKHEGWLLLVNHSQTIPGPCCFEIYKHVYTYIYTYLAPSIICWLRWDYLCVGSSHDCVVGDLMVPSVLHVVCCSSVFIIHRWHSEVVSSSQIP